MPRSAGPEIVRDCQCARVKHEHGEYGAYNLDRCRCNLCRKAHMIQQGRARRLAAYGRWQPWGNRLGAERRLQALFAVGWSWAAIGQQCGMDAAEVRRVGCGLTGCDRMARAVYDRIADVYDRLWNQPPPQNTNGSATRTINRARRAGYVPPFAWDDIDDPDEVPDARPYEPVDPGKLTAPFLDEIAIEEAVHGRPVTLTYPEKVEAVRRLAGFGYSDRGIAEKLHNEIGRDGIAALRRRFGIPRGDEAAA